MSDLVGVCVNLYFDLQNRGNTSTTVPLTVKQITDAYESSSEKKSTLMIDGVDVYNVRSKLIVLVTGPSLVWHCLFIWYKIAFVMNGLAESIVKKEN